VYRKRELKIVDRMLRKLNVAKFNLPILDKNAIFGQFLQKLKFSPKIKILNKKQGILDKNRNFRQKSKYRTKKNGILLKNNIFDKN